MYEVRNEQFEGPLDLLLQLIEKEQLDINQISLAKITGGYLERVAEIKGNSSDLADFLVIAAKLLYLKSKNLIPNMETEEEEAEIEDLEARLQEYKQVKAAAKHLEQVLAEENRSYQRRAKNENAITFTPPANINRGGLFAIFQEILDKAKEETPEQTEITPKPSITLEEKRDHIVKHLSKSKKISFRGIMGESGSRMEMIVTFLAILEMVKQKEIRVQQNNNFADFMIMSVK